MEYYSNNEDDFDDDDDDDDNNNNNNNNSLGTIVHWGLTFIYRKTGESSIQF